MFSFFSSMFSKFRNHILTVLIADVTAKDTLIFSAFNLVSIPALHSLWINDYELLSTLAMPSKYLSRILLKTNISRKSRNAKNSHKFCRLPVLMILEYMS